MRIAFLNADVPNQKTGYQQLTNKLIALLSQKHDVHLLAYSGEEIREYSPPEKVRSYEVIEGQHTGNKRLSQLRSLFSKESMIRWQFKNLDIHRINQRLKAIDPDVIIVNHVRTAWVLSHLDSDAPSVYIAHNCESVAYESIGHIHNNSLKGTISLAESKKIARMEKDILKHAHCCITLTSEDLKRMQQLEPDCLFKVIPPGVDLPALNEKKEELSLLLVGSYRWEPKKQNAIWLAKEVMPLITKRHPDIVLNIVGAAANSLRSEVNHSNVKFHSDVASTEPYFNTNCIFLVPERQEGGIKIKTLEAASYGLPIVSTLAGIEGTGLVHGQSCMIANSKEEFAVSIDQLLRDEKKRIKLGEHARDQVAEHFNWAKVEEEYEQLLNASVNERV